MMKISNNSSKKYVVYDGDCGICTKSALYINKIRKTDELVIVPSFEFDFQKYNLNPNYGNITVIFVDTQSNKIFFRTRAIGEICLHIKGSLHFFSFILRNPVVPFLFNPFYNLIAKYRSKISSLFGLNACVIKDQI